MERDRELKEKSVAAAVLLNLFLPGFGYGYLELWGRGFALLIVWVLLFGAAMAMNPNEPLQTIPAVGAGIFVILGVIDGYLSAQRHNRRVEESQKMPCPFCAERIRVEARVCRFCRREVPLEPTPGRETRATPGAA